VGKLPVKGGETLPKVASNDPQRPDQQPIPHANILAPVMRCIKPAFGPSRTIMKIFLDNERAISQN
jgi:hypothetical protein